jgi:hypothetical protein
MGSGRGSFRIHFERNCAFLDLIGIGRLGRSGIRRGGLALRRRRCEWLISRIGAGFRGRNIPWLFAWLLRSGIALGFPGRKGLGVCRGRVCLLIRGMGLWVPWRKRSGFCRGRIL